jgi:hypothetical protein
MVSNSKQWPNWSKETRNPDIRQVLQTSKDYSELLGFWILSIGHYFKELENTTEFF